MKRTFVENLICFLEPFFNVLIAVLASILNEGPFHRIWPTWHRNCFPQNYYFVLAAKWNPADASSTLQCLEEEISKICKRLIFVLALVNYCHVHRDSIVNFILRAIRKMDTIYGYNQTIPKCKKGNDTGCKILCYS